MSRQMLSKLSQDKELKVYQKAEKKRFEKLREDFVKDFTDFTDMRDRTLIRAGFMGGWQARVQRK